MASSASFAVSPVDRDISSVQGLGLGLYRAFFNRWARRSMNWRVLAGSTRVAVQMALAGIGGGSKRRSARSSALVLGAREADAATDHVILAVRETYNKSIRI